MWALKTPLRYPSDNIVFASKVALYFPRRVHSVCSPFFNGGSVEIELINRSTNIYGYYHFKPLVEFWQCLLGDPTRLYKVVNHFFPIEEEKIFYHLQNSIFDHEDIFLRSAIFYICNRSTEGGHISYGKFATQESNFNELSMLQLSSFKTNRLHVKHCSKHTDAIAENVTNYLYCAPPRFLGGPSFVVPRAQEELDIDHMNLHSTLSKRNNWLLLYNFHPKLLKLYNGCRYTMLDKNFDACKNPDAAKNIIFMN